MAILTFEQTCAWPIEKTWDWFVQPLNWASMTPDTERPDLLSGPERISDGVKLDWKLRRWGLSQRFLVVIRDFQENLGWTEEQLKGPLGRWIHERRFEALETGVRLFDRVEVVAPSGILGRLASQAKVEAEIQSLFRQRERWLAGLAGDN